MISIKLLYKVELGLPKFSKLYFLKLINVEIALINANQKIISMILFKTYLYICINLKKK